MTARTKIFSLSALLALVLVTGLWFLNRPRPASPAVKPTLAQSPAPAASEPETTPASEPRPVVVAQPSTPVASQAPALSALQPSSPSTVPAQAPVVASALQPSSPSAVQPAPSAPPAELAATARMYAAHAPLRTPEVADPDSKANKQILGTMVTKMLAQPATPPPSARATQR